VSTYVFGPYRFDAGRRILYSGTTPAPIPERLARLLLALIRAGSNGLGREALAREVWGEGGVTDTNLTQHVYTLRMLLGERRSTAKKYIVTVPGKGYVFAEPVTAAGDEEENFEESVQAGERLADLGSELFQAYCSGSYHLEHRTASSLQTAIRSFETALRIRSDYVPALIGLARAHAMLAEYWHATPEPAFRAAKNAIHTAHRKEPGSSMTHALLGELYLFADWDWANARKAAEKAIALNPQSAFARNNATWYYVCRGEIDRALSQARLALLVDPASLSLQLLQARVLAHGGEYDRAIAAMSNILAEDANFVLARRYRAQAFALAGRYKEALEDLTTSADESEDLAYRLPMMARAHAGLGDVAAAVRIYDSLRQRSERNYVTQWNLAIVCYGLGRHEETLRYLQRALALREPALLFLRTVHWFSALERRRAFRQILKSIGP
jgi:DNA-binding winged helix-turn-helix (wHTH) protein/Tfp pilus assembly protein PilF